MTDKQLFAPDDVVVEISPGNNDVLYAMRAELFFRPNEDGTPSASGRVIFHTEWWHYSGEILRGKSLGPRVESEVEPLLGETYGEMTGAQIVAGIKAAFVTKARRQLGQASGYPDPE